MTPGGWITMLLSVGSVTTLFAWCVYRVLKAPAASRQLHGLEDIDTHDED